MPLNPKTYTLLCGCFAAFGAFLYGYDLGVIAGVIVAPNFLNVTNHPSDNYVGFFVSSLLLGAFAGCIPASIVADRYSRRSAIMAGAIVFILGGGLQTGARNREMVMAGRFFAGFGIGMLALLCPLYNSEIAHPSIRGRLTSLQQFFLGIGALFASLVVYGCDVHHPGTALEWRLPLGLQIMPAVPLATLIFFFPESPRWLMAKGREQDCIKALARLHASGDESDTFVVTEAAELKEAVKHEQAVKSGWKELYQNPQNFRRVLLGIILQFSVQMTGVSAIQYFSPTIFANFNFSVQRSLLFNCISNIFALAGELSCVLFVDKLGRRWPLIICNLGVGVVFVIGTILQALYPAATNSNKAAGYAFVVMIWIFQIFFSSGIGPLSWAYPVEIMNTNIRAKGFAVATMACWISNFMIGQVTPRALAQVGWRYYIVFAVCGFTNAFTMWALFPETKGRTLEEMDDYFEQTHWFVPISKHIPTVAAKTREEELRRGIVHSGIDAVDTYGRGDKSHHELDHNASDTASADDKILDKA